MNNWLELNGIRYEFEKLSSKSMPRTLSEFEKKVWTTCQDWFTEKQEFEFATSGSTGIPKRIFLTRMQLEASARLTENALQLKSGYTALLCLDPAFIAGYMMIVRALVTGMNLVAIAPLANPFEKIPSDVHIDFAALVPYQLQALLDSPRGEEQLNFLKVLIIGGAAPGEKLKAQLRHLATPVYATYGMTETISHIALQKINDPEADESFNVLPGITIRTDSRGCLEIQAPHLNEPVTTNDLVELLTPNRFRWLGRWDHVINTGGIKVIPEKIEKAVQIALHELGLSNRIFVSGLQDDRLGQRVVVIAEGTPFNEATQNELFRKLAVMLGKYEVPKEMIFVPRFIETDTLKLNRKATLAQV